MTLSRRCLLSSVAIDKVDCCPGTLPPVWSCMKETRIINLKNNNVTGARSYVHPGSIDDDQGAQGCKLEHKTIIVLQACSPQGGRI